MHTRRSRSAAARNKTKRLGHHNRTRTVRNKNNKNKGKGGATLAGRVFRAASRVAGQVVGKGPDRVEKAKQVFDAFEEALTRSNAPEKGKHAVLHKKFSVSPFASNPLQATPTRKSYSTSMFFAEHENDDFKTPNKSTSTPNLKSASTPPNLGTRVRQPRETTPERRQRLGFRVAAPTFRNPTNVVGQLFP